MTKPIIAYGNPIDGLSFYGPFDSLDEATAWAEEHLFDDADGSKFFWPVPLYDPGELYTPGEEPPE